MKTNLTYPLLLASLFFICFSNKALTQQDNAFKEIQGIIVDGNTKNPLVFADIVLDETNISTVTNTDGEFLLKIPNNLLDGLLSITHLGYEKLILKVSNFSNPNKSATPKIADKL